jgi:exodeoxyribonuclease VII small subunit
MTAKKKEDAPLPFEEALKRLETIVHQLEQGDVPLEKSLALYEEGIRLSQTCAEHLAKAEMTVKRLSKELDGSFILRDDEVDQ